MRARANAGLHNPLWEVCMSLSRIVQMLSLIVLATVTISDEGRASATTFESCTWCDIGPEACLANEAYIDDCVRVGCSGDLPGCMPNWGNCQGGIRITCNDAT